jgi:hypothetical protein
VGIVGMLLVTVREGPANISILVTLADLHNEQSLTGVAVEDRCLTHDEWNVSVERIASTYYSAIIIQITKKIVPVKAEKQQFTVVGVHTC